MITQNEVKEIFDYKDGGLYWKISRTNRVHLGDRAGNLRKEGYRRINIGGTFYYEHRLIWLFHHGYLPKQLDHINRTKIDNRIENLRDVSHSQNMMNSIKRENCSSKYKGVTWDNLNKNWRASINKDKIHFNLGSFDSEDDAGEAYNRKAIELFGEFKNLNEVITC